MFRGVYRYSGDSADGLGIASRLAQPGVSSDQVAINGPLAVACAEPASRSTVGEITCTLDGHLYEREALARALDVSGRSDAEVIARGYGRYGEEMLTRLRGKFAIVLWDNARRQGLLSCDLLSAQSLFFWRGVGYLVFASELQDLLSMLQSRPGPDSVGFLSWLGGWTVPADRTLYEGVSRLPTGELVELEEGAPRRAYWRPKYSGTLKGSRKELAEGLSAELERAVAKRLSARSSGVVLSGGLDSSIVTAVAARVKRVDSKLRTYSVAFPGAEYDESWKVRSLTRPLGIEPNLFELEPQGGLWTGLHRLKRWGVPLMTNAALIDIAMVAAAGAEGTEVVLDGQTGDELFGHSPCLLADRLMHGRVMGALRVARRWPAPERPITGREQLHVLKAWGLRGAAPHRFHRLARSRKDPNDLAPPWLLPAFRSRFAELEDRWAWKARGSGPRWWRYQADLIVREPHRMFRLENMRYRAADAGAVSETPLYDFDLIDYVLRLPPELAFDWAVSRPLAREAVRGMIPDDVRLNSRKAIFSPFCFDMVTGADAPGIERLITAPDAELGAFADIERIRRLWHDDRPKRGPRYGTMAWGATVWRLAAAECWLRSQSNPEFVDETLAHPDVRPPSIRPVSDRRD